ncbi:hypothetical protein ACFLSI_00800 [Bacteroidota bacterium]
MNFELSCDKPDLPTGKWCLFEKRLSNTFIEQNQTSHYEET